MLFGFSAQFSSRISPSRARHLTPSTFSTTQKLWQIQPLCFEESLKPKFIPNLCPCHRHFLKLLQVPHRGQFIVAHIKVKHPGKINPQVKSNSEEASKLSLILPRSSHTSSPTIKESQKTRSIHPTVPAEWQYYVKEKPVLQNLTANTTFDLYALSDNRFGH